MVKRAKSTAEVQARLTEEKSNLGSQTNASPDAVPCEILTFSTRASYKSHRFGQARLACGVRVKRAPDIGQRKIGRMSRVSAAPSQTADTLRPGIGFPRFRTAILPRIDAARNVMGSLDNGASLHDASAATADVAGFGIGHMLHYLTRSGFLMPHEDVLEMVVSALYTDSLHRGDVVAPTRHSVIGAMKRTLMVDPLLHDRTLKPPLSCPSMELAISAASGETGVKIEDITSARQSPEILNARFMAIWIMRSTCGYTLAAIGAHVGGRDYTTALNAWTRCALAMEACPRKNASVTRAAGKADEMAVAGYKTFLQESGRTPVFVKRSRGPRT